MDEAYYQHQFFPELDKLQEHQLHAVKGQVDYLINQIKAKRKVADMPPLNSLEMENVINFHNVWAIKNYQERHNRHYGLLECKLKVQEFEGIITKYVNPS